ncbi:MAG: lactate utilization protein [Tissierellia bacterium]|nr:lactate utilization protein [Tissierellia bacterium]
MRNIYVEKDIKYDKLGPMVVENLKKRHFDAYYVQSSEDALKLALELISESDVVSWGGSMTITSIGLQKALTARGNPVIDRDTASSTEERVELMRKGLLCDTFISSVNAISEDGQIVNIDGNGNRVAAMIYGPKQVVVVAGMNKIAKDLDVAISKVRTETAPMRAQSFPGVKTPCAINGSCSDCTSVDSVCAYLSITRISRPAGKIKVILVGEDLGM